MAGLRAQRILDLLAEHHDGLPTPQIAEMTGELGRGRSRNRAVKLCGNELRSLERRGDVWRIGRTTDPRKGGPAIIWALSSGESAVKRLLFVEPKLRAAGYEHLADRLLAVLDSR